MAVLCRAAGEGGGSGNNAIRGKDHGALGCYELVLTTGAWPRGWDHSVPGRAGAVDWGCTSDHPYRCPWGYCVSACLPIALSNCVVAKGRGEGEGGRGGEGYE